MTVSEVSVTPVPPRWRGRLHQIAFYASIPAGLVLVALAKTSEAKIAAVVYSFGVTALYGTSAAYHRGKWSPAARRRMKRLDHSMIFVLIAATYTPICLLALEGTTAVVVMVAVWSGALLGLGLATAGIAERRGIGFALYIGLGWIAVVTLPQMLETLSPTQVVMILMAGILYTVGAIGLGTQWPDPFPETFGYHEVWHVMVVVAGLCLAVVVFSLVVGAV